MCNYEIKNKIIISFNLKLGIKNVKIINLLEDVKIMK